MSKGMLPELEPSCWTEGETRVWRGKGKELVQGHLAEVVAEPGPEQLPLACVQHCVALKCTHCLLGALPQAPGMSGAGRTVRS